jgi:hypothetical protein
VAGVAAASQFALLLYVVVVLLKKDVKPVPTALNALRDVASLWAAYVHGITLRRTDNTSDVDGS